MVNSSDTEYSEIPGCLDLGLEFQNYIDALKKINEGIDLLGLPELETHVFYAVLQSYIEKKEPAIVKEITSIVRASKNKSYLEERHVHPILDRLSKKNLIFITKLGRLKAVYPGSIGQLQNFWLTEHFVRMYQLYGVLSNIASLIKSIEPTEGNFLKTDYISNPPFKIWVTHGILSAKDKIIIVAKYFRSIIEYPEIVSALRKAIKSGVDITVILGELNLDVINKLKNVGVKIKRSIKPIYYRVMLIDDNSGLVNIRIEKGERRGFYFENSVKDFNQVFGDYVDEVIRTAEEIDISKFDL